MESDDNVHMDLSVPKPVDMSMPLMQGVNMELTGQASIIFTSVILANPNMLAGQMESMEVFVETDDGMAPLLPEDVRGMAPPSVERSVLAGPLESTAVEVESEPRAAGQDGLSSQNLVPQERCIESDIQFNNPPGRLVSPAPVGTQPKFSRKNFWHKPIFS